jgi:hypothetical protein
MNDVLGCMIGQVNIRAACVMCSCTCPIIQIVYRDALCYRIRACMRKHWNSFGIDDDADTSCNQEACMPPSVRKKKGWRNLDRVASHSQERFIAAVLIHIVDVLQNYSLRSIVVMLLGMHAFRIGGSLASWAWPHRHCASTIIQDTGGKGHLHV